MSPCVSTPTVSIGRAAPTEGPMSVTSGLAAAGEVRPDTRAEDLMRLMIGAVLLGVMLGPDQLDDAWADRIATIVLEGVRP